MKYEEFQAIVKDAGLAARHCHETHWQILGGLKYPKVNVWANTKRGFRFQLSGGQVSHSGTLPKVIELAGPPISVVKMQEVNREQQPPWKEPETGRVGLIRWLWRMIW